MKTQTIAIIVERPWTKNLAVFVGGPTASGKTKAAISLAQEWHCPILSFDSRQFYREMHIGTAVPSPSELAAAQHFFIQDRSVQKPLSAGAYEAEALDLLKQLFQSHPVVLFVGGSGLYQKAVSDGFSRLPKASPAIRKQLNEEFNSGGLAPLLSELAEKDPQYFKLVDKNNPQRVIRALEMIREQGEAFSQLQEKYQPTPRFFRSLKFALNMERSTLYERINTRVDRMVEDGLFEEAIALYPFHALDPLKTVGYKEVFDYKEGKINQRQTIEAIKQNSRRYAKRQLTWYRREKDLHWFQPDETEAMKKMISAKL